jgi:hypothetical protein
MQVVRTVLCLLVTAVALLLAGKISGHESPDSEHVKGLFLTKAAPANDLCTAAQDIGLGVYFGQTDEATVDGAASCGASLETPDVWFRFVAPADEQLVLETVGSSYDTVLSLHEGCPGSLTNELICNDDAFGLQSAIRLDAVAGEEYLIRLSGSGGATGDYQLTIGPGGALSGTVTRAATGDPIESMLVGVWSDTGQKQGFAHTDATGSWSFGWLPTGSYTAVASSPFLPYVGELYEDTPCPGGTPDGCVAGDGDAIAVASGSTVTGVYFELEDAGTISGLVQEQGTLIPLQGATVDIYADDGTRVKRVLSDETGQYQAEGLFAGDYYAGASGPYHIGMLYDGVTCPGLLPNGCALNAGTPIDVTHNTTTSGVSFQLPPSGVIHGTVTATPAGDPIESASVQAWDIYGSLRRSVSTQQDGSYMLGGLTTGPYYLVCAEDDHVRQVFDAVDCEPGCDLAAVGTEVIAPEEGSILGYDFSLRARGRLTGTVTASATANPLAAEVHVYDSTGTTVKTVETTTGGTFDTGGLAAGTYFVLADNPDYVPEVFDDVPCPDPCDPSTGTPISVTAETVTSGIDLALQAKGRIAGNVIDALTGDPIPSELVYALDETGDKTASSLTEADGSYVISGLEPGSYYAFTEVLEGYSNELYNDVICLESLPSNCDLASASQIAVSNGMVAAGIDFALFEYGSISGTVTDAETGEILSGFFRLYHPDGERVSGISKGYFFGTPYSFSVPAGSYYVSVIPYSGHMTELYDDIGCAAAFNCDLSLGTLVTVNPGADTSGIDFDLELMGMISGTVTDAVTGDSLRAYVYLYDELGDRIEWTKSDSAGFYQFAKLHTGVYRVSCGMAGDEYIDVLYQGLPCPGGPAVGCDVTQGTPVPVTFGQSTDGIDLALPRTSAIEGWVSDELTGVGINTQVLLWSTSGEQLRWVRTDSRGLYRFGDLTAGSYHVSTNASDAYLDEIFDNIPCYMSYFSDPGNCDPNKGTPIVVPEGTTVRFVDFGLRRRHSAVAGTVSAAGNADPLAYVTVDVWDALSGTHVTSGQTNEWGWYFISLDSGSYKVSTNSSEGYSDQVYPDIGCARDQGVGCDIDAGAVVEVTYGEVTSPIDFSLQPLQPHLFSDGFERGDTSLWSVSVGL